MKKISFLLAFFLFISTAFSGCSVKKSTSSSSAESQKVESQSSTDETEEVKPKQETAENSDYKYNIVDQKTITITQYIGKDVDVIIPEKINGLPVTKLEVLAFSFTEIKSVIMPDTIDSISYKTFENCQKLEKVILSKNITEIPVQAFGGCIALKDIFLPDGLTTFDNLCFEKCEALESIKIPKTVTVWGFYCFQDCTSLKEVEFEDGIETINGDAPFGSTAITKLIIPASVTKIADDPFYGIPTLKTIIFEGDAPNLDDAYTPFGAANKDKKIYYNKNTSGWENCPLAEDYTLVAQ